MSKGFSLNIFYDKIETDIEPTDVIFVVHGIGYRHYEDGVFKESVKSLATRGEKVLKNHYENKGKHLLYIVIEWSTELKKTEGMKMLKEIDLKTVSALREINNNIVSDIVLYSTEYHRQVIIDIVSTQIISKFNLLIEKFPKFKGRIGFIGHSLGGVISYDILCNGYKNNKVRNILHTTFYPLPFKVDYFASLGSPIPTFMLMRGLKFKEYNVGLNGIRYRNFYHSHDPFAYRIEPLVSEEYKGLDPVSMKVYINPNKSNRFFSWGSSKNSSHLSNDNNTSTSENVRAKTEVVIESKYKNGESAEESNKRFKIEKSITSEITKPNNNEINAENICNEQSESKLDQRVNFNSLHDFDDETRSIAESCFEIDPTSIDDENIKTPLDLKRFDYVYLSKSNISGTNLEIFVGLKAHFSYWTTKDISLNMFEFFFQE